MMERFKLGAHHTCLHHINSGVIEEPLFRQLADMHNLAESNYAVVEERRKRLKRRRDSGENGDFDFAIGGAEDALRGLEETILDSNDRLPKQYRELHQFGSEAVKK